MFEKWILITTLHHQRQDNVWGKLILPIHVILKYALNFSYGKNECLVILIDCLQVFTIKLKEVENQFQRWKQGGHLEGCEHAEREKWSLPWFKCNIKLITRDEEATKLVYLRYRQGVDCSQCRVRSCHGHESKFSNTHWSLKRNY